MGSSRSLNHSLLLIGLLSIALIASGCATLGSGPLAPDTAWFETQLASGQYSQAGNALQRWQAQRPDDPQLPELAKKLEAAQSQLRDAAIADAQQLRAQQHWADADQRLLAALQLLPDDAALKAEYAQFDELREKQRSLTQHEFDLAYARSLPVLLQHARAVYELKPQDTVAATQLKYLQDTASSMVGRLSVAAQRARQQGDMPDALESLRLAAQLSGEQSLGQQARQLEQELAKTQQQSRAKTQRAAVSALAGELAALDELLDKSKLEAAQSQLKILSVKYAGNAQLQQRTQRFERQRQQFVGSAIEQGKRYYSSGDLARAIETWEAAFLLDPGNQDLRDRIDRAQRFRAKVESLQ
jgi:hypothetical protein